MASHQIGFAPVNGLQLYYEVHGAAHPDQPPLVLLHGGGDTIETSFGHVLPAASREPPHVSRQARLADA